MIHFIFFFFLYSFQKYLFLIQLFFVLFPSQSEDELKRTLMALRDDQIHQELKIREAQRQQQQSVSGKLYGLHMSSSSSHTRDGVSVTSSKGGNRAAEYPSSSLNCRSQKPFDPNKYDDRQQGNASPILSTAWSVSASMHSNSSGSFYEQKPVMRPEDFPHPPQTDRSCGGDVPPEPPPFAPKRPIRPEHTPGCFDPKASDNDFSINSTKKVLNFYSDSKSGSSYKIDNAVTCQVIDSPSLIMNGRMFDKERYAKNPSSACSVQSSYYVKDLSSQAHNDSPVCFHKDVQSRQTQLTDQEVAGCLSFLKNHPHTSKSDSSSSVKSDTRTSSSPDPLVLKHPLNTDRLRPIRQRTKNVVVRRLKIFT